jgi:hypothetical protein
VLSGLHGKLQRRKSAQLRSRPLRRHSEPAQQLAPRMLP